jgi:hypothetical protein
MILEQGIVPGLSCLGAGLEISRHSLVPTGLQTQTRAEPRREGLGQHTVPGDGRPIEGQGLRAAQAAARAVRWIESGGTSQRNGLGRYELNFVEQTQAARGTAGRGVDSRLATKGGKGARTPG